MVEPAPPPTYLSPPPYPLIPHLYPLSPIPYAEFLILGWWSYGSGARHMRTYNNDLSWLGSPGINHYCVVADPGSHNYTDCLVSLVWSWEAELGVYPPWQVLKPGRTVLAGEATLDSEMELLRSTRKLERVSAYR